MKNRLLILVLIFTSQMANAQITLEKTYSTIGATNLSFSASLNYVYENINSSKVVKYMFVDSRDNSYKIYNIDHSLYKNGKFYPPSGYTLCYATASTKNFNSDDKVEFIVSFTKSTNGNTTYSMKLINEDGVSIKDFGNSQFCNLVIGSDNKYKLICTHYAIVYTIYPTEYHFEYINDIYSIGGIVSSSVSSFQVPPSENPYPNPSNIAINLPYQLAIGSSSTMKILDISGQLIEQKTIDSNFNNVLLRVESYKPGVYFFEYNGISNKFIVN